MTAWICATCGVQSDDSTHEPAACPICLDERQYVGWEGQRWTTQHELASGRRNEVREEEKSLFGIGTTPSFAIGQRALLVATAAGNILWDCISLLDDATVAEVGRLGGIKAIACSHPHFYGSVVDWADAFEATIHLPLADREWVQRRSSRIEYFVDRVEPVPGVTVARIGGHFPGAAVLHWPAGAGGEGALLTGDTITVVQDRSWVSFMWSYPNLIPLDAESVRRISQQATTFSFTRIYGGWWGRVVVEDGAEAIRRSAERYIARLDSRQGPDSLGL